MRTQIFWGLSVICVKLGRGVSVLPVSMVNPVSLQCQRCQYHEETSQRSVTCLNTLDTVTNAQCYQLLQIYNYLLLHIPTVFRETDDLTPPPPSR